MLGPERPRRTRHCDRNGEIPDHTGSFRSAEGRLTRPPVVNQPTSPVSRPCSSQDDDEFVRGKVLNARFRFAPCPERVFRVPLTAGFVPLRVGGVTLASLSI